MAFLSHIPTYDTSSRNDSTDNLVIQNPITDTNKTDNKPANTIYRYKFREEFVGELYKFSKIHQYDHRKDFKEACEHIISMSFGPDDKMSNAILVVPGIDFKSISGVSFGVTSSLANASGSVL